MFTLFGDGALLRAVFIFLGLLLCVLLVSCSSIPASISYMTPEQLQALAAHKNVVVLCSAHKSTLGSHVQVFVNIDKEFDFNGKVAVETDCKVLMDNALVPIPTTKEPR